MAALGAWRFWTEDFRDRLVVDKNEQPQNDLESRTKHALGEAIVVSLL